MSLFQELKHRNVLRAGATYVVFSWLVIQVVETVFPAFGIGDAAIRIVVITLGILLVPAMVLAWVFEITPDGLRRERDLDRTQPAIQAIGRKMDRSIVVILALALSLFAFDKFLLEPARDAEMMESARQEGRSAALAESYGDRSIAVLPFADMSPDSDQEYFSDGISEELLNLLARIPELRVISRSSAFSFKDQNLKIPEIASRLEVAYVLEGSVRKSGNLLRITAQLIEGRTDTHLWSETYDRPLTNIFLVQDEIASAVVEQIKGTLQISVPSLTVTDPEAYTLLLQGRHVRDQGTPEGYDSAIEFYRRALEIDPRYTEAWDELATVYQTQAVIGLRPADEGFELARETGLSALAIDPDYAPAHATLGWGSMYHDGDLATAVGHYQRALELDPAEPFILGSAGILLQNLGHLERGLAPIEYMVARDPVYPGGHYTLGLAYLCSGRLDQAVSSLRRALTLSPGFTSAQYSIGVALLLDGQPTQALSAFEAESNEAWRLVGLSLTDDSALSRLIAEYGDSWAYNLAYVFAFRGEADAAFEWLSRAVEIKDPGLGEILKESLFSNLFADPRWVPFLETLGKSPDQIASINFRVTIPKWAPQ